MRHPVFTPTAIPPAQLDEATVGRGEIIDRLSGRLHDVATTAARPHTLIVGSRGSGKTHLLSVVLHRSDLDPAVRGRLAVAWIPEDALSIGTYDDLLVELALRLGRPVGEQARALRRERSTTALERLLLEAADGRVLVLVLENLDRIFAAIGESGQAALRGFVETTASIVLLASTPLLFPGVSSRDKPWYGSFDTEHLSDLTLAEGTELLRRTARDAGDTELASFVGTPVGQARLRAVEHLAGGSPRLWHILSGCMTVPTLDELVPAVEALLDELAPYYQQRLWELPPGEQKLVVELARQPGARTVNDLAEAVGASNRAAATSIGRLADARWVRGRKMPGTDQRTTWYELREPLLRHHLQYRDSRGEPLRLIIEFLQVWYSQEERRHRLAAVDSGSVAERHLVRTLLEGPPPRSDSAWANRDPDELLADARCWVSGTSRPDRLSGSPVLGAAVEQVVLAARGVAVADTRATLAAVTTGSSDGAILAAAVRAAQDAAGTTADRLGAGLRVLRGLTLPGDDRDLLLLLSVRWDGQSDAAAARDRLQDSAGCRLRDDGRLSLAFRDELAFWTGQAGDAAAARDLFAALLADQARVLGAQDRDTLASERSWVMWTLIAGSDVPPVADALAPGALASGAVDALHDGRASLDGVLQILDRLPEERSSEVGFAALLAVNATQESRRAVAAAMGKRHPGPGASLFAATAAALEGDAVALAGLAPELRSLVYLVHERERRALA